MSSDRAERRRLRRELKKQNARCVNCAVPVDDRGHRGLWVPQRGPPVPHYICVRCFAVASKTQESLNQMANTVALALCTPGGNA